ncbi:zinc finger, C3HC4 type domain-containing protein [Cryptosporidium serpentis]
MNYYQHDEESNNIGDEHTLSWSIQLRPENEVEQGGSRNRFNTNEIPLDNNNVTRELLEIRSSRRLIIALIINTSILLFVISLFCSIVSILVKNWGVTCDRSLKIWCIVWFVRFLLSTIIRFVASTFANILGRTIPTAMLYFIHIIHIFGIAWWFYGIKLIFITPPDKNCSDTLIFAQILFWYQFILLLLPILLAFLLCISVFNLIHRIGLQRQSKSVPAELMDQIESMKLIDYINKLKNENYNVTIFYENNTNKEIIDHQSTGNYSNPLYNGNNTMDNEYIKYITLGKACPICVQDINDNDNIRILPCDVRHIYHKDCIDGWFQQNNACPICRSDVVLLLQNK